VGWPLLAEHISIEGLFGDHGRIEHLERRTQLQICPKSEVHILIKPAITISIKVKTTARPIRLRL
jgi:hypothetical protein